MRPLRVGVWGLGRHAVDRILPALALSAPVQLYGVCGRNRDRVSSVASSAGCLGWTDARMMLDDSDVDVVYVATPTGMHAEHGQAVLDAGKHLWCEKPFTCSAVTTQALVDRSRALGLTVGEGLMYLHHPQFRQLAKYIRQGRLGRVRSIGCRFGIPPLDFQSFRSDPARGGGALLDVGCYTISAALELGAVPPVQVRYASMTTRPGHDVDTDGQAVLDMPDGVVAQLEWRTGSAYVNDLTIWGDEGSIYTDKVFSKPPTFEPEFHVRDAKGVVTIERGEPGNHFVAMMDAFAALVSRPDEAEAERRRITGRAEVLDRIRMNSQLEGSQ